MLNHRSCLRLPALVAALLVVVASTDVATAKEATQFYLVGVGPGDPDLATLRAVRVMEEADVIFCWSSIAEKFSGYLEGKPVHFGFSRLFPYYGQDPGQLEGDARREAEKYAAKRSEFSRLVRAAVAHGETVAVLDHGDPLVYGPSAWMLEEFEDLEPQVVPGVSCFNAANAALCRGITTSDETKSVILTAADWPGKTDTIEKLAAHGTTMALFTMKTEFQEFIEKLSEGYPPETPIAIVKHAGYADREEVIQSTLGRVLEEVDGATLPFEYMIYIGDFLTYRYNAPLRAGQQ